MTFVAQSISPWQRLNPGNENRVDTATALYERTRTASAGVFPYGTPAAVRRSDNQPSIPSIPYLQTNP